MRVMRKLYLSLTTMLVFFNTLISNEAHPKIIPDERVHYQAHIEMVVKHKGEQGMVTDGTFNIQMNFSLAYLQKPSFPELEISFQDFSFDANCYGIKISFDSNNVNKDQSNIITDTLKQYVLKEHRIPLTKDANILLSKSSRYEMLPLAKCDVDGYRSLVDWIDKLVTKGLDYNSSDMFSIDLGHPPSEVHYTSLIQSISSEHIDVAATLDCSSLDSRFFRKQKEWVAGAFKFHMKCDRRNALQKEIKGIGLISNGKLLKGQTKIEHRVGDTETSFTFKIMPKVAPS